MQHYCPASLQIAVSEFYQIEELIKQNPSSTSLLRKIQKKELESYTETFQNCESCVAKLRKEHGDLFFDRLFIHRYFVTATPFKPVTLAKSSRLTQPESTPVKQPRVSRLPPDAPVKAKRPTPEFNAEMFTTPAKIYRPVQPPSAPTKRGRPDEYPDDDSGVALKPPTLRYTPNIGQIPPGIDQNDLDEFTQRWHESRLANRF